MGVFCARLCVRARVCARAALRQCLAEEVDGDGFKCHLCRMALAKCNVCEEQGACVRACVCERERVGEREREREGGREGGRERHRDTETHRDRGRNTDIY